MSNLLRNENIDEKENDIDIIYDSLFKKIAEYEKNVAKCIQKYD